MDSISQLRFSSITYEGEPIPLDTLYKAGDTIYIVGENRAASGRYVVVAVDSSNPTYKIFTVTAEAGTGNPVSNNIMDVAYIPN